MCEGVCEGIFVCVFIGVCVEVCSYVCRSGVNAVKKGTKTCFSIPVSSSFLRFDQEFRGGPWLVWLSGLGTSL